MQTEKLKQQALTIPEKAKAIVIKTGEDYGRAGEILKIVKGLRKKIGESYDPIIAKANQAHKEAISQKKKIEEPLVWAEGILKPKMSAYLNEEERKRKEQERIEREKALKAAEDEKLKEAEHAAAMGEKEEAEEILTAPVEVAPVVTPKAVPKIQGVSSRKMWKWRIKNKRKIDPKFMTPDEEGIAGVVRSMGKNAAEIVGGIDVWEETIIASRAAS